MISTPDPAEPVPAEAAPIEGEPVAAGEAVADPVLLAAREFAREALGQITDPQTIGSDEGHEVHEAHVLTLFFECRLPGYPGWRWAATLSRVDEDSPVNVLEAELLPGAGAVVAPEWVPWSVRLAQYREAQAKQAEEEAAALQAAETDDDDEETLVEEGLGEIDDEGPDIDDDPDVDDDDDEEDDEALDVDEDGFADIDEHDLHDDDDDVVDELDVDEEDEDE